MQTVSCSSLACASDDETGEWTGHHPVEGSTHTGGGGVSGAGGPRGPFPFSPRWFALLAWTPGCRASTPPHSHPPPHLSPSPPHSTKMDATRVDFFLPCSVSSPVFKLAEPL